MPFQGRQKGDLKAAKIKTVRSSMTQAAKIKELTESTIAFKAINHYKDQFLPIVEDGKG